MTGAATKGGESNANSPAVLLINPRTGAAKNAGLPLSIIHLGAALEERWPWDIVDGNRETDPVGIALGRLSARPHALCGITVMPGPQVITAIEISSAIRKAYPALPIVWGGYFPTLYPDAAINASYVDYLVRGQGEQTLLELLAALPNPSAIRQVAGLTWKDGGRSVHNPDRPVIPPSALPQLPYHRIDDIAAYLRPSFLGRRTACYQAALGCRYKCGFCGVVSMWNGKTALEAPERMTLALGTLRDRWGADAVQFFDHNFFDKEDSAIPILEALAKLDMPYWCYARADTLANFSAGTWEKVRKSRMRMTYVGAEAASDAVLKSMQKGTRVEHTFEVARRCRENGIIPEFSFVLGGPEDPEGEIETTFEFIRRLKTLSPESEIILYFYSPTPQRQRGAEHRRAGTARLPVLGNYGPTGPALPTTPEEWTQPQWISWVCHEDAPWLTPRTRRRVKDFARVLACRFPTAQDHRLSRGAQVALRGLASWRYATRIYDHPWELRLARRLVRLREPQRESI
ncbi:MAG TPA: radical SAM protein [Polyangia bacterium]|nr:radical SAM protein [Polyangia bacterium]